MEIGGVGVFAALAAGLVSFLSPCVLPLVPGYLSAVTGVQPAELERADWHRVIVPSLLFIASFSLIFILLGLTATAIGQTLRDNQDVLEKIAGVLMIALGVIFIGSMFVSRLAREWHVDSLLARAGHGGPLIAGAAFAVAWTPCVGPTLGAINALAAVNGSVPESIVLLTVYSAGLAIPFLLTAIAFSRMTSAFAFIKRHYWLITAIGGGILIAMGILVLTGEFFQLNIEAQKLTNDLGLDL
jgi:cytochrome c-type biogenesis protein